MFYLFNTFLFNLNISLINKENIHVAENVIGTKLRFKELSLSMLLYLFYFYCSLDIKKG